MKKTHLIIALLLLLSACQTRHSATTKTSINTITDQVKTAKKDYLEVDTGKVLTQTENIKQTRDSDEVEIIPDSGFIQKVKIIPGEVFTYIGTAKSIKYKQRSIDQSVINTSIQDNKFQTIHQTKADSSSLHQIINKQTKNKVTDSKAGLNWIAITAAIVVLLVIIGFLVYKFL